MKRILIFLTTVIFVVGVFVGGGLFYFKFFLENKEFTIVNSYENLQEIPEITLADLYTGRLQRFLNRKFVAGEIKSFNSQAVPLPRYEINSKQYSESGIEFAELVWDDIQNGTYLYSRSYPYQLAAIYKLNIGGATHYLFVYEWLNKDRTVSFTPIVVPEKFVSGGINDETLKEFFGVDTGVFLSPTTRIRDVNSCLPLYFTSKEFCEWSVKNKWIVENLGGKWDKQKIPHGAARFPWTFSLSNINILDLDYVKK